MRYHVPQVIRDRDRTSGLGGPVLTKYERITFNRDNVRGSGMPAAQLIGPGHPLSDAVVDLTIENFRNNLRQGAVLIDSSDIGETPRLLVALTEEITNGREPAITVSKRFDFIEIEPTGDAHHRGHAPYLDYDPLAEHDVDLVDPILAQPWLSRSAEEIAVAWAVEHSLPEHERWVRERVQARVDKTRSEVRRRLIAEVNHWDAEHARLLDDEAAGKTLRVRPETALRRARVLEERLKRREAELDAEEHLQIRPPIVAGAALVIPQGLLDSLRGTRRELDSTLADKRRFMDLRAIEAVMAAERAIGRMPEPLRHGEPGYEVRSVARDGRVYFIKVRGRLGSSELLVTRNEALTAKNLGDEYRLVLVQVSERDPSRDQVRYLRRPFDALALDDFRITKFALAWREMWDEGGRPC